MRPRGPRVSWPVSRKVGQASRQNPHRMHFEVLESIRSNMDLIVPEFNLRGRRGARRPPFLECGSLLPLWFRAACCPFCADDGFDGTDGGEPPHSKIKQTERGLAKQSKLGIVRADEVGVVGSDGGKGAGLP